MKALLETAGQVAYKMAATVAYDYRPKPVIYEGLSWEQVFIGGSPVFEADTYSDMNALIAFFYKAYSTSAGMVIAIPGKGAQYILSNRDSEGNFLSGDNTYLLRVPPNVPAANYWAVVNYDADTRGLLDNGGSSSVASNQEMALNDDGSADIYLSPEPPDDKDANWIRTIPGRGFFTTMRLYSPTEAFFDQTWRPEDVKMVR